MKSYRTISTPIQTKGSIDDNHQEARPRRHTETRSRASGSNGPHAKRSSCTAFEAERSIQRLSQSDRGQSIDRLRASTEGGREIMRPQHWWHCSDRFNGDSFNALRITPSRSVDEPLTPRLCVSPTVCECFSARLFREGFPVYCYRTEKPCRTVAPKRVWDSIITRERWLIHPCQMILARTIEAHEAYQAQSAL